MQYRIRSLLALWSYSSLPLSPATFYILVPKLFSVWHGHNQVRFSFGLFGRSFSFSVPVSYTV